MNRHNRYKYDFYKQMTPNERILHRFEKRLVRGLQGILFSDALDFMYDDTLDAKLRKDGINPMKDTYVALHKAKQHALYGEPPMYDWVYPRWRRLLFASGPYCIKFCYRSHQ